MARCSRRSTLWALYLTPPAVRPVSGERQSHVDAAVVERAIVAWQQALVEPGVASGRVALVAFGQPHLKQRAVHSAVHIVIVIHDQAYHRGEQLRDAYVVRLSVEDIIANIDIARVQACARPAEVEG